MPTLSFDLRGKTAGKAYLTKNHVQLNAVLLVENSQSFVDDTVGHEVAHLATHAKHGRAASAHGAEWQRMMQLIGQEPRRCHSFDTSNSAVSQQTFRYVCGCKEHFLSTRRHGTARRREYSCKRCGQPLRFVPVASGAGVVAGAVNAPAPAKQPSFPPIPPPRSVSTTAPRAPTPSTATRSPTPAMASFAQRLATQLGERIPPGVIESFQLTSAYITAAKEKLERKPASVFPPSQKQLEYATHLSKKTGRGVPPGALANKDLLSQWLTQTLDWMAKNPIRR